MPDDKTRTHKARQQRVPRIAGRQATEILAECDTLLLDNSDLLANLRRLGFNALLSFLSHGILQLALQPDVWGEQLRARLMSDIMPAMQGDMSKQNAVSVDDVAHSANIVVPCFLLELGRRNQHIQIEFPPDPTDSSARFKLCVGKSYPTHSIDNEQLAELASSVGEELVGLCYFGDQQSRESIEAELRAKHSASRRSPSSLGGILRWPLRTVPKPKKS